MQYAYYLLRQFGNVDLSLQMLCAEYLLIPASQQGMYAPNRLGKHFRMALSVVVHAHVTCAINVHLA